MIAKNDPRVGLDRFCATPEDFRTYLQVPFLSRGKVCRTNGHVLLVTEPEAGVEYAANGLKSEPRDLFEKWADGEYLPLPKLPKPQRCPTCLGKGFMPMSACQSCKGEGVFEHFGHAYDCKECEATGDMEDEAGEMRPCFICGGLGHERSVFKVRDVPFELIYLHWIAKLPNVEVAVHGATDPLAFRFDGGTGLVMPRYA
jgi:hypothetical protein